MTNQTPEMALAQRVADEVRGELAKQRKTAAGLAAALGISQHTAGTRLNGKTPFNVIELARTAKYLGLSSREIVLRADREERLEHRQSSDRELCGEIAAAIADRIELPVAEVEDRIHAVMQSHSAEPSDGAAA